MSRRVSIVIPAYREALYIEKTLRSIQKSVAYASQSCPEPFVIIVVNNPQNVSQAFRKENQMLTRFLRDTQNLYDFPITVLDYTDPGLTLGVGQARKLGMEYAIARFLFDPLDRIVSLDADTTVNLEYIHALFREDIQGKAFTIAFEHPVDDMHMVLYELYLRYMPKGLSKAKSPFDFIAIGSALGCTVKAYKDAGGMPAKTATEDFHFLNKLRRLGPIKDIARAKVYPSDRISQKVTLGTGYFLGNARINLDKTISKLVIPSPQDFERLKTVIENIQDFFASESLLSLFEESKDLESFEHLHKRKIIEKLYKIKEGTADMATYFSRIMEVLDGLETIRLLRMYAQDREPIHTTTLVRWAAELGNTQENDPRVLLQHYRDGFLTA